MKLTSILWIASLFCIVASLPAWATPAAGVALYGRPKYPAGFPAFEYVNPDAPKGGSLHQAAYSSFDTLNPFVLSGVAAPGVGLMYDTLMKASLDEPFSLYALVADSIDISPARDRVAFHINPRAAFSDGSPITAADVAFSFDALKEQGIPMYRAYYRDVARVETPDDHTIVFHLSPPVNRELPLILGELPVLSRAWWQDRDFTKTSLDIPVSSGPYLVDKIVPNRSITYRRNPDYWARDLNVNRGAYNFDEIRFDVYRDTTVATEAFKAGLLDIRLENEAKKWAIFQTSDLVRSGQIIARVFPHQMPTGMQGFVFNLRRPQFQDPLIRRALAYAFDFEWTNRNLFYGSYRRTESFFENSYLRADPLPTPAEAALLAPFRDVLPPAVFSEAYRAPRQGSNRRANLQYALFLLKEAGCTMDRFGVLRLPDGQPFRFEILLDSASGAVWERVVLPFVDRLKRLGITATVRTVDAIQYKNRLDKYDYDMIVTVWGQSFSPGNEQRSYWGSDAARTPGSWNYSGIQNPAVDALIDRIVGATTREEHLTAVHALDRVLLHLYLVIPHWHLAENRYLFWDKFGIPATTPIKGTDILLWWSKPSP